MALWEKLLYGGVLLAMIIAFYPRMRGAMAESKQAQEKHWGTVLVLAAALVGFVIVLIAMVR